jgi:hypothetical protein
VGPARVGPTSVVVGVLPNRQFHLVLELHTDNSQTRRIERCC